MTSPAAGPALVLTLFSASPLSTEQWTSLLEPLTTFLPVLSHTSRQLTRTGTVQQSLLSTTSPFSQKTCTALARSLPLPDGVQAVLAPLSPLHKSHPRTARLAVFDMDSTLIQQEVIDELARSVGRYEAVSAITEAAMAGDPAYADFEMSLRARVKLLAGVETTIWQKLREEVIRFTPGARELIRCLKSDGWTTAVLSGGFVDLAEWVKEELGLDVARANTLEAADGKLTGRLLEGREIVDGAKKRELLLRLAEEGGVQSDATIAVGDGSNDLLMMGVAGLGIAFNAKPRVQAQAPAVVNGKSLVDVLYVLGWTEEEIEEVMKR